MQPVSNDAVLLLAILNLGGGEIILILALVLILFGAKKLPELARGLGRGACEFGKAIEDESEEAGRSVGGIYGKPAAQAITPDNHVAELYDPAVFRNQGTATEALGACETFTVDASIAACNSSCAETVNLNLSLDRFWPVI
jgi:sec-independent protein translocase protein TatA